MASVALKSGDTIWGLVAKKLGAGASNADIQKATEQVLKSNGETWASAKTMKAGEQVNLDVLDPKAAAAPAPAAAAPAADPGAAGADPGAAGVPANPALGEAEKRQQEILAQLGLNSLPPGLAQLLNTVYQTSDPTVSPFLGSLAGLFGGAVNVPGATPGRGPSFNGLSNFLGAQAGLKPNNTNSLAFNSGSFVNQISGIQFTAFDPARILAQNPGLVS